MIRRLLANLARCPSRCMIGGEVWRCELPRGHARAEHVAGEVGGLYPLKLWHDQYALPR